jgi:hypothetical protein
MCSVSLYDKLPLAALFGVEVVAAEPPTHVSLVGNEGIARPGV